jgi:hypothetical protein
MPPFSNEIIVFFWQKAGRKRHFVRRFMKKHFSPFSEDKKMELTPVITESE